MTSTGLFPDTNFKPSCSWIAVRIEVPLAFGGGVVESSDAPTEGLCNRLASGDHSSLKSYLPESPVLSTTGLWSVFDNINTRLEIGYALTVTDRVPPLAVEVVEIAPSGF